MLSSVQVWAQDAAAPDQRVFQALISGSAAERIQLDKVDDFADTRFIRLFEAVKNVARGDVIEEGPAGGGEETAGHH